MDESVAWWLAAFTVAFGAVRMYARWRHKPKTRRPPPRTRYPGQQLDDEELEELDRADQDREIK